MHIQWAKSSGDAFKRYWTPLEVNKCDSKNTACTNWVTHVHPPFMDYRGHPLEIPSMAEIAKRHGKSPAQIFLPHGIQGVIVVVPKGVTPQCIREDVDASAVFTS